MGINSMFTVNLKIMKLLEFTLPSGAQLASADKWACVCPLGVSFPDEFNVLDLFTTKREADARATALNESPQWDGGMVEVIPVSARYKILSEPTELMIWRETV